ncbi:hypothetical protein ACJX0J_015239, partial [Zea mays]
KIFLIPIGLHILIKNLLYKEENVSGKEEFSILGHLSVSFGKVTTVLLESKCFVNKMNMPITHYALMDLQMQLIQRSFILISDDYYTYITCLEQIIMHKIAYGGCGKDRKIKLTF